MTRNPLVRRIDRVEALITVLAVALVVVAIPVVVSLSRGYGARLAEHTAAHNRTLHSVDAVVVDVKPMVPERFSRSHSVRARWSTGADDRIASVRAAAGVAVGDHVEVWLDAQGAVTTPPRTESDDRANTVAFGIELWLTAAALCVAALMSVRAWLAHRRSAMWDAQWQLFNARDGGWSNRDRVD